MCATDSGREELGQEQAETSQDALAILPWKFWILESVMQNGREAALLLLESGMCVWDGNKSNLLIFVSMREIKNEVAIPKKIPSPE